MFTKDFFPTLKNNPGLAYFDSASSTQTHQAVIDAMNNYYTGYRSNVGRGAYGIANQATAAMEKAREQVAELLETTPNHIVFTTGATQGLNWVANWYASAPVVIVFEHDHNSNISPWLAQGRTQKNGRLKVIPVMEFGMVNLRELQQVLQEAPSGSLLSFSSTSNVTGESVIWEDIARMAHDEGLLVCVDFSQTIAHKKVDLSSSPIDYAVFSAHKMYGPTGIGALYIKQNPGKLPPQVYGGGSTKRVNWDSFSLSDDLSRHESGTPNIAGIIGFGVAADIISFSGYQHIQDLELQVYDWLYQLGLFSIPGLKPVDLYTSIDFSPGNIISFVPEKVDSSDVAVYLEDSGIAVRTGNVCAHPFGNRVSGGKGIVRISIAPYNDHQDCVQLVTTLKKIMSQISYITN